MFQFYIKGYGLKGDGSGYIGSYPFQLTLRVVGVSDASPKNIWINDYDTVPHAKTDAESLFSSLGAGSESWTDSYTTEGGSVYAESLSTVFSPTFGTGSGRGSIILD